MTSPEDHHNPETSAEQLLRDYSDAALVGEAHALMHGERHLTIEHGYPETADDTARLQHLSDTAWRGRDGARTRSIGGGGDYTTITVEGPHAEEFVDSLAQLAQESLNPGWWKVRRSAR
ncbi:hypothetical protein [Nocardia sp. NPDC047648]|uniref:hypothetical protein n=1 Tax=Nocardia sp. NPDC047648 TaxID=3155625 RepID=UPI0033EDAC74